MRYCWKSLNIKVNSVNVISQKLIEKIVFKANFVNAIFLNRAQKLICSSKMYKVNKPWITYLDVLFPQDVIMTNPEAAAHKTYRVSDGCRLVE